MDNRPVPLTSVPCGRSALVIDVNLPEKICRRLMDLGLIKNTRIDVLRRSPSGDPTAYRFRGSVIALRSEEASKILVTELPAPGGK